MLFRSDWKSKIEDEDDATLVRQLKKHLTRGGNYVDVRRTRLSKCTIETDTDMVAIPQCDDHKFFFRPNQTGFATSQQ